MKYSLAFLFVASTAFLMASAAPKRAAQQSAAGLPSAPRTEAQLLNELRLAQNALEGLGRRVPDTDLPTEQEKLADAEQLRAARLRLARARAALNLPILDFDTRRQ
uniref:Salivary secreted protein n=1 Tax=Mayetiola destructor TaxID=39758 RepID=Q6W009_MAYDE|nr:salivary secreted protein [Mayetiola destructor]